MAAVDIAGLWHKAGPGHAWRQRVVVEISPHCNGHSKTRHEFNFRSSRCSFSLSAAGQSSNDTCVEHTNPIIHLQC